MRCRTCNQPFIAIVEKTSEEFCADSKIWSASQIGRDDAGMSLDLISIGRAAVAVQIDPKRLVKLAKKHGVRAVVSFNGVQFFDAKDIERIRPTAKEK